MTTETEPVCPYCKKRAELTTGDVVYPKRPDLRHKSFWRCVPCQAWVGCHPGTQRAMGVLANKEHRTAKQAAHAAFDPLWRNLSSNKKKKGRARSKAYAWLADQLGIHPQKCHIGMLSLENCRRTVEICTKTLCENPNFTLKE